MSNRAHEAQTDENRAALDRARAPHAEDLLVLAIDTASDARSVCVARGGRVLASATEGLIESGSAALLREIDEVLASAGVALREIGLFAVACGPGSFTGLRAGLATVKAFAKITGRPAVGVPTLHAVALSARARGRTVAAIPAGRGEVFAQLLSVGDARIEAELSEPAHVKPNTLVERAAGWGGRLTWAGGGAHAHRELIREGAARAGYEFVEARRASSGPATDSTAGANDPSAGTWMLATKPDNYAAEIVRLGLISTWEGWTVDGEGLRALYVRPSDAELKK
jgi:tRNA threonylcarbamoyladenosine biosynthesis protein TsaB